MPNLAYNRGHVSTLGDREDVGRLPSVGGKREKMIRKALLSACLPLLLLSLSACSKSLIPKLSGPSKSASSKQLKDEGKIDADSQTAHFSVPPQQLAALLIKTAKTEGWAPKQKAIENDERWVVTVRDPDKPLGKSEQNIFIESDSNGGSNIRVGSGMASLPEPLLSPLKANVTTHYEPPKQVAQAVSPPMQERDYSGRKAPADVVVTAGTPTRPYRKLGKVRSSVQRNEKTLSQKIWDAPLALVSNDDEESTSKTRLFNKLSANALRKYGSQVDAIIKARYKTRTDGSAFASGLAVQYVATEERLDEIERLHDKGYLTDSEYDDKRAKILQGL